MIVTHYGRLGSAGEEATPSESAQMHAAHFSQTRTMRQLRGYYSTGPSRTQSPQYGSGAGSWGGRSGGPVMWLGASAAWLAHALTVSALQAAATPQHACCPVLAADRLLSRCPMVAHLQAQTTATGTTCLRAGGVAPAGGVPARSRWS